MGTVTDCLNFEAVPGSGGSHIISQSFGCNGSVVKRNGLASSLPSTLKITTI